MGQFDFDKNYSISHNSLQCPKLKFLSIGYAQEHKRVPIFNSSVALKSYFKEGLQQHLINLLA